MRSDLRAKTSSAPMEGLSGGDFRATPIYEPDQMSSLADLHVYR